MFNQNGLAEGHYSAGDQTCNLTKADCKVQRRGQLKEDPSGPKICDMPACGIFGQSVLLHSELWDDKRPNSIRPRHLLFPRTEFSKINGSR